MTIHQKFALYKGHIAETCDPLKDRKLIRDSRLKSALTANSQDYMPSEGHEEWLNRFKESELVYGFQSDAVMSTGKGQGTGKAGMMGMVFFGGQAQQMNSQQGQNCSSDDDLDKYEYVFGPEKTEKISPVKRGKRTYKELGHYKGTIRLAKETQIKIPQGYGYLVLMHQAIPGMEKQLRRHYIFIQGDWQTVKEEKNYFLLAVYGQKVSCDGCNNARGGERHMTQCG